MNDDFNLDESQKRLMELLVSRTLNKYGVKRGSHNLSEREKENLRATIQSLQKQADLLINSQKSVTEKDVNPVTNTYEIKDKK
ncbi:hypothetical protein D1953_14995 [Peribacillus asahii]|uniref:Uncharacterized protein n=1 Tax=Peribacillus asahii TaxID=228899 RepID=A0A398B1B3_9BACI|nr:hypothetical protein [Peribacillus asahii]RID83615.1 hypothetical protein D1953_14995 [Peribacillus asahii]